MSELSDKVRQGLLELLRGDSDLGFGPVPARAQTVYVAQQDNCLWYTWDPEAEERRPIHAPSLTGTVDDIYFVTRERGGQLKHKMRLYVQADAFYALECGADTTFARGVMEALDELTADELEQYLTIEVREGESQSVVLPNVWAGGNLVLAEDSGRSWQEVGYEVAKKLGTGKEAFERYDKNASDGAPASGQRSQGRGGAPRPQGPPRGGQRSQNGQGGRPRPPRGQGGGGNRQRSDQRPQQKGRPY